MSLNDDKQATLDAAWKRIAGLDFEKLNRKLQFDDPKRWSKEKLAQTELSYRRFLALNALYPDDVLAVNRALDDYWHEHILDTQKYYDDCTSVFGRLLHHYPYYGMPGEPDEGENVEALAVTEEIWLEVFGTTIVGAAPANARLSLDRVLGGLARADDGPDAGPKGCKNGQHCQKLIGPGELLAEQALPAILESGIGR